MKKISYLLVAIISIFIFTSCSKEENFIHDTKYYSQGNNQLEFTVKNINQFEVAEHISGAYCLEFEIEINNKTPANYVGFAIRLYDFNFYFTKPQSIFEMYMYESTPQEQTEHISVNSSSMKTIFLRVIFNPNHNEPNIVEDDTFVLELCDVRI